MSYTMSAREHMMLRTILYAIGITLSIASSIASSHNNNNDVVECDESRPPIWPNRFRIVQNKFPGNTSVTTFYDFILGANLILDGEELHDLELNNHSSYYFYPHNRTCKEINMPVGILRPDWLVSNFTALGISVIDGKKVFGYTKDNFIDYYADASDCTPVRWYFHSMKARFDTVTYEPDVSVPDKSWFVPPTYCA
jgi:hypothetical protein